VRYDHLKTIIFDLYQMKLSLVSLLTLVATSASAFTIQTKSHQLWTDTRSGATQRGSASKIATKRGMATTDESERSTIFELEEIEEPAPFEQQKQHRTGPLFISQGEILPESLNPDLSNPKQTRVIAYMLISLIPVLFLIPLMIGSRDLIPLDALPPVNIN
jgi:hypothetical protein